MPRQPTPHLAPFLFLRLPKEIRLMIYERLPDEIDYYSCHGIRHNVLYSKTRYILKTTCASTAILATCRAVHSEASSIIKKNIVSALAKPARITILEGLSWWCPRRMFGELLLVIYWRWHLLSHKEFSMSTRDVAWREPRHCIQSCQQAKQTKFPGQLELTNPNILIALT
jgi:hypothetical protein